tara:strand:- start:297 stop:476 length:180 start_codon:yes stop_codon:yes gene_type:complete
MQMSKKKKSSNEYIPKNNDVVKVKQSEKSNTLVFGGVLVAMISIGLLIFVLNEKVFQLS